MQGNITTFQGTVRNLTDRPISGVMVVVTLYDEDGARSASADALVDLDPLPPGAVSHWKVSFKNRPDLSQYALRFRQWHVGAISTRDDRGG